MSDVPTQGVFDFVSPGENVVLHRGDGVVDGAAGRVELWVYGADLWSTMET